jgi:hypothetical protein
MSSRQDCSRGAMLAAVACVSFLGGCRYYLEGDAHGTTPFVIVNNTTTEILGVKFWPVGATEPLEYATANIEPGERREFSVKPGAIALMLVGQPGYRMVETEVRVAGPTELVVTSTPWNQPATARFTQVAVAPKPYVPSAPAAAEDDDPANCEEHGGCGPGEQCMPNAGPMNANGWHPPRCVPL